jgi:hypothetical protein
LSKVSGIARERLAITWIILMDIDLSEFAQIVRADFCPGVDQATRGSDDHYSTQACSRPRERICISELSAKVESAKKLEDFSDGGALAATS